MLHRPIKRRSLALGLAVLVASAALGAEGLSYVFQGEPGQDAPPPDMTGYLERSEADALVPDEKTFLSSSEAEKTLVLPQALPDPSQYVLETQFAADAEGLLLASELSGIFYRVGEVPSFEGYLSHADAEASFAKKSDIPAQADLVYPEDVPDTTGLLTVVEFDAEYARKDELDGYLTAAQAKTEYLQRDEPLPQVLLDEIAQIVSDETMNPTCPKDMADLGDTCIDIYEASVYDVNCDEAADATPLLPMNTLFETGFPASGNWTVGVVACSIKGRLPSTHLTWFQAAQACALANKRLCTQQEWHQAAQGTPSGVCKTQGGVADTGSQASCRSATGAYDMVGNVSEYTAEWTSSGNTMFGLFPNAEGEEVFAQWGDLEDPVWGADIVRGVNGHPLNSTAVPASTVRGGSALGQGDFPTNTGPLAVSVALAANKGNSGTGFRCCRRK